MITFEYILDRFRESRLLTKPCLYSPIIEFFRSCLQSVARPHEHADSTYIKCAPTYKYPTLNSFWYRSKVVTTVPLCLHIHVGTKCSHEENRSKICGPCGKKLVIGKKKISNFRLTETNNLLNV